MAEIGLPLCVHGEVTDAEVDIFDREAVFIDRVLEPLRGRAAGAARGAGACHHRRGRRLRPLGGDDLAATITTHHLIINRNAILVGGIRPHYYCLPVAKREKHRLALREAATSGDARFFLGTDSAPHARSSRKPPAAAPASSPRRTRWPASPRSSRKRARWTGWRPSPA